MEFIDTTGHVFSIESYDDNPVNIKYKEGDYIFWIKDDEVSINNYYIKPIRFIIPTHEISEDIDEIDGETLDPLSLTISVDSQFFKLLSVKTIQEKVELNNDIKEKIEIYYDEAKSELTLDDFYFNELEKEQRLIVYANNISYYLFQFYVISKSKIPGTFLSNILIKIGKITEKTELEKNVWLTRDQMYDYLLKQTMSDINIYEYDTTTHQKTFWYTIPTGYGEANEIITRDDEDYRYRVRNWGSGLMNPTVYHYIYKIPQDKWLLKDHWYVFEGNMYETCHYCGSIVYGNHDGYGDSSDGAYNNPSVNSLIDVRTGNPFYPEDYVYNEQTNNWIPKSQSEQTRICQIGGNSSGAILSSHFNGQPCVFLDNPIQMTTTVKDIFFDIDNEKVTNNKDGGYITIKKYEYEYIYTQITVGGTFIDECEELIINGRNMGIQLPKDIIKSIYQSSFYNKYPDEILFKDKMKELLLNYMSIKGECGNFKSAVNSLKWFGWEGKITISQLIKTDNEFQDQYIIDYFNIDNDIKNTYKYFNKTNFITLSIKDNNETGQNDTQTIIESLPFIELYNNVKNTLNSEIKKWYVKEYYSDFFETRYKLSYFNNNLDEWVQYILQEAIDLYENTGSLPLYKILVYLNENRDIYYLSIKKENNSNVLYCTKYGFGGEGQPLLEDLFDKVEEVYKDDLIFYKPYYDFMFDELSIKLDCLRYYYQRYFLPLHLRILRASIEHKVYANDIKMNCYAFEKITSSPVNIPEDNVRVEFPDTNQLLFYKSMHLIDDKFNEFSNYNNQYKKENLYYINENCVKIPIKFINDNSRYSQDNHGDYILINGEYFKIIQFLYFDEETNVYKIANKYTATHYRLSENMDIMPLHSNERYSKISSYYFNCKIVLTVTTKIQNPKGHYILIDGQWKYKEKFYDGASTLDNLIESENGNYIKLYNELVYVNPKYRYDMITQVLIKENSFNYYQNIDQYYVNLVFIPRLLKIYNIDWLNSSYRVSVLCNNKWFTYDFIIKVPNLYLDFGKLSYRYFIKDNFTEFKQIREINGSQIYFNSFMYQPDLVTIDTLFKDEDSDNVLSFIDKIQETRLSRNEEDLIDTIDEDKMYEFVRKYYRNQIKVPFNKKFYNRIHLFDIYLNDDDEFIKLEYDNNPMNIQLYSLFFPEIKNYEFIIDLKEKVPYDVYLMHDKYYEDNSKKSYWYIVMISKYPIGNYSDESLLDIYLNTEFNIGNYLIKYSGFSLDKFLVNRMDIQKANGYNHFNTDDLIIVSINNNDYQFNIDLTNKWKIQRIYDPYKNDIVNSNANIMIIPTNNFDQKYSVGYYNIELNYIIDGINHENHICKGYYRINKDYEEIDYEKYSYDDLFTESDYFIKLIDDGWDEIPETVIEYFDGENIIKQVFNITGKITYNNWKNSLISRYGPTKIVLGTNVTEIDQGTFNGIDTENGCELWISSTVSKITIPCFESASTLSIMKVHPNNEWFDSRGNCNAIILKHDDPNHEHLVYGSRTYLKNTMVRGCANTFIPNSVEDFADHILCSVKGLNYLDTGNNVKYIGINAIWKMENLETLILGASISKINCNSGITSNAALTTLYIRAKIPPLPVDSNGNIVEEYNSYGVFNTNSKITIYKIPQKIYVEPGCGEIYKNHYAWKSYADIIEEMPGEF